MSRPVPRILGLVPRFPRPRGDEPNASNTPGELHTVFPARAGMSPTTRDNRTTKRRFPRPRGDEPDVHRD